MKGQKIKKVPRWPDYDVVPNPNHVVTFGTTLFMRKDQKALRIVFPAGQFVTFAPLDESVATDGNSLGREGIPLQDTTDVDVPEDDSIEIDKIIEEFELEYPVQAIKRRTNAAAWDVISSKSTYEELKDFIRASLKEYGEKIRERLG